MAILRSSVTVYSVSGKLVKMHSKLLLVMVFACLIFDLPVEWKRCIHERLAKVPNVHTSLYAKYT